MDKAATSIIPLAESSPAPPLALPHIHTAAGAQRAISSSVFLIAMVGMLVSVLVRFVPALYSPFPLGDGGMFYVIVNDILAAHFSLPHYVSYDAMRIPLDYPPLGFYLIAALHAATGWSILTLFRLLPPICSVLSVGAFALLANALLTSRLSVAVATFAFAFDIDAFEWQIKGGGITRSTGFLLMILFLWQLTLMVKTGRIRYVVPCGVLAGLTALTHLEWAYLGGASAIVYLIFLGRNQRSLLQILAAGAIAAACVAPWFFAVVTRDGLVPLVGTLGGTNAASPWYVEVINLITLRVSMQSVFSVPTLLAILGAIYLIARRDWLLPTWFIVAFLIGSRQPEGNGCIALCLMAGVGAQLIPLIASASRSSSASAVARNAAPRLAIVALVAFAVQSWIATSVDVVQAEPVLTHAQVATMTWVDRHIRPGARFVIVSGEPIWGEDNLGEWFDAIAQRPSIATVQGSEWLPSRYIAKIKSYDSLETCSLRGAKCIVEWLRRSGLHADYLLVSKAPSPDSSSIIEQKIGDCCGPLRASLARDSRFVRVYSDAVATIYRLRT